MNVKSNLEKHIKIYFIIFTENHFTSNIYNVPHHQQTQRIILVSILIVIIGSGFYKNMKKLIINLPVTSLSLRMLCQRKELKRKVLL